MADYYAVNTLVNGSPGFTDTGYFLLFALQQGMKSAGWTVVQSSNGTSFGATDYWSSYFATGGAWIVLQGPGGRQICFWVNTVFDQWTGKIIYDRAGGFTFSGATATSPGAISATAVYLRGSAGAFSSWFGGGTKATKYIHILCKDVSDGSFWVMGSTPVTAASSFYHSLAFMSLTTLNPADPDPYAFYCAATSATADTGIGNSAHLGQGLVFPTENGATSGYWWAWARGNSWRSFQPRYDYIAATNGDINPYSSSNHVLSPFGLGKTESGFREHKGYLKYARVCAISGLVVGDTVNETSTLYAYAPVGGNNTVPPQGLFFWDSATASLLLN